MSFLDAHTIHSKKHPSKKSPSKNSKMSNPWDPNCPLEDFACVCGYIDPPPRNLSDRLCDPCEARRESKIKKEAEELEAQVTAQFALPDTDPTRIFTEAELRDVANIHCDKRGFNRILLRAMRKRLNIRLGYYY